MIAVAFVLKNNTVHLYTPSGAPSFTAVPANTIIRKHLKAVPELLYNVTVSSTATVPSLEISIGNKFHSFNKTLIESGYFRKVTGIWVIKIPNYNTSFSFEVERVFGVVDFYNYKGSVVDLTLR